MRLEVARHDYEPAAPSELDCHESIPVRPSVGIRGDPVGGRPNPQANKRRIVMLSSGRGQPQNLHRFLPRLLRRGPLGGGISGDPV